MKVKIINPENEKFGLTGIIVRKGKLKSFVKLDNSKLIPLLFDNCDLKDIQEWDN